MTALSLVAIACVAVWLTPVVVVPYLTSRVHGGRVYCVSEQNARFVDAQKAEVS